MSLVSCTIRRPSQATVRRRRNELFRQSPTCHWCGDPVVRRHINPDDPHKATLDHIKSRRECTTEAEWRADSNTCLACHSCNQLRNEVFLDASYHEPWHHDNGLWRFLFPRTVRPGYAHHNAPVPSWRY